MDRFESMSAFVAVVEEGSFSAASRRLGMSLATLSRKVSELENFLHVALLTRTTRRVVVTEIGQFHFETCRRLLEELAEAERVASGEYRAPRGELVIAAPSVLGRIHLAPIVTEFLAAYPDVDVELRLSDRIVNLAEEGIDIALRVEQLPDSSLKAIRLGVIRHVVCASPAYLAMHETPMKPEDLASLSCITFTGLETAKEWIFRFNGDVTRVPVRSRFAVSSPEAAADAAAAGVGITRLLCYQVSDRVNERQLRLLLRDYEPEPLPVSFVFPGSRMIPQKLKAFIDFAKPRLKPRLVFEP